MTAKELTDSQIDFAQAERMPVLHEFFKDRTLPELLLDLNWLSQYLIFREYQQRREADEVDK